MTQDLFYEKQFSHISLAENKLPKGDYECCSFNNCNFANGNLSGYKFTDCTFSACDLSLANVKSTAFRDVKFKDCKMLGLRFDTCNDFGLSVSFDGCQLNHSSFFQRKIKKTIFKSCQLQDVDFAECDLSASVFDNCDLAQAIFEQTALEGADFRSSYNYAFDPELNRIKKAKFSSAGLAGLLGKYNIQIEG